MDGKQAIAVCVRSVLFVIGPEKKWRVPEAHTACCNDHLCQQRFVRIFAREMPEGAKASSLRFEPALRHLEVGPSVGSANCGSRERAMD